jgi:alpha-galactosidase
MDTETRAIFTNPEVIAIDQDSLGAGPRRIRSDQEGIEVWEKPLGTKNSGTKAILLLNLSSRQAIASVRWSDLRLKPNPHVRDLWSRKDLGEFGDRYSTELPSHGSVLLKVSGKPKEGGL